MLGGLGSYKTRRRTESDGSTEKERLVFGETID